jgi:hypothetical protein
MESNYKIDYKELMAIIYYCKECWPKLDGTVNPIEILTDHKNVKHYMTTKL